MAKFTVVKLPPKHLLDGCIVIDGPDFRPEIDQCKRKKPMSGTATANYLREIVATIGLKYAGEDFNALTDVNVSKYVGVPCATTEEVHNVILKIFATSYPKMLDLYVEYQIKHRPAGTRLIYFCGDRRLATKFFEHGLDELKEKEVPVFLGLKEKKVVGKPALSDQEIAAQNDTVV